MSTESTSPTAGSYWYHSFVYDQQAPLPDRPGAVMALPSNSVPEPDLSNATTHDVVFAGGMHGHTFLVLRRSGKPTDHREWQDTVLMSPGEAVEIAFVADNPGDWMFNCRILEHQDGGMMTVLRVS